MRSMSLLFVILLSLAVFVPFVTVHFNPHAREAASMFAPDVCKHIDDGTNICSGITWIFEHCSVVLHAGEHNFQRPLYYKVKPFLCAFTKDRPPKA